VFSIVDFDDTDDSDYVFDKIILNKSLIQEVDSLNVFVKVKAKHFEA